MVKEIVKDPLFLAQKSLPATKKDLQTAKNLEDTLKANAYRCVGLAANMIGVRKNIITFFADNVCCTMLNPVKSKSKSHILFLKAVCHLRVKERLHGMRLLP